MRRCTLDFSSKCKEQVEQRIASWLESDTSPALRGIRYLTVVGVASWQLSLISPSPNPLTFPPIPPPPAPVDDRWSFLVKLLEGLKGLKEFTFAYEKPIPIPVLKALHTRHPTAPLHIRNWTRKSIATPFGDPEEMELAASPSLRSIEAHIRYGFRGLDLQYEAFMHIVTSAPNLQSYHYSQRSIGQVGCIIYTVSSQQRAEEMRERLKFTVENPVRKHLKAVHSNTVLSSHMLEKTPVAWESLERLSGVIITDRSNPLDASVFASLKSLQLSFGWITAIDATARNFNAFISSLPPLESLSLTGAAKYADLSMLLLRHGPTLRSLNLHELESPKEDTRRNTLTSDEILDICNHCPLLEDFGLDIDRTVSHEREEGIYTLLTTFPALQQLTLQFDLGLATSESYYRSMTRGDDALELKMTAYKSFNESTVKELWSKLGKRLSKLIIRVGEKDRDLGRGYPASWVLREQSIKQYFYVTPHERDDRPGELDIIYDGCIDIKDPEVDLKAEPIL